MKVGMYYKNSDVRVEEIPVPKISDDEILVKVMASGICGSDVMEWYRIKKAPIVLGHEIAGDIVEVGKNVKKYKVGDRVFVSHHIPCNTCRYCLSGNHTVCDTLHTTNFDPGGFSQMLRVPALNVDRGVFLLPDEMSYDEGAFVEPLACVVRGQRAANLKPGQTVLILGSGISGLLHLKLAIALGAGKVITTDINENRLKAAKRFGAYDAIPAGENIPKRLKKLNDGRLADLVIVCTGALSVFKQALKCVDRAGTVLFFAPTDPGVDLPIPVNDFWRNGITLLPSYGNSPRDAKDAIELIRSKRVIVDDMVTDRLKLEEIAKGFKLVSEGKNSIKVIILPNS
ncbi:MAG: zinc-dependent dehydrogenase [Candidatus Aureabacteria bacterium]|nr:zinc-dependent dehydrogenase [Candidatus Auribacterota bacterium]